MSLRSHRRLALLSTLAATLVLSACGSSSDTDSGSDSASGQDFTIGISNPQGAEPILNVTQDSFIAAAERDGIEVKALDAQLDPAKQVTDIDQFVAQQVDLIVVYPLDENSLKPALKRADDAGIKIVGWAALNSPEDDLGLFTSNVESTGIGTTTELVDYVKTELGTTGNALGLGLGVPVPSLELLLQQYQDIITDDTDITWLGRIDNTDDGLAGAQKVVATALTKYQNDVQAILTYSDAAAIGASVAAKEAGLEDVVIVGTTGDEEGIAAIKDGRIDATADLVPWRTGLILEAVAKAILEGEDVPSYVETTSVVYTKDNVAERLAWPAAQAQIADGTLTCADAGCPDDVAALVK